MSAGQSPEAVVVGGGLVGSSIAYHLTLARGFDPDQPRAIRKVTETH